jgi:3-(methylthio)propanoyl-CoA dehydrogenase
VMAFGDSGEGAVGELVGEPNEGMRLMFTMMNDARLGVGLQGVAIAERAYQQSLAYAQERRQGRGPTSAPGEQAPIVEHADVRRMLLTQKASIEAMRALCYANAHALDLAEHALDPVVREQQTKLADLLTPLSKSWSTDLGVELTSVALQIQGGMGYVEETGAAQHYRDARIAPIYEGTNGIQALDLVGRKLPYDGGAFVKGFLADLRTEVEELPDTLATIAAGLRAGLDGLEDATAWLAARREDPLEVFAGATPYLRVFASVVGGVLLARGAAAAQRRLDAGDLGGYDPDFLATKVTTARFFTTQLLPAALGLLPSVTAGADDLYAWDPAAIAP